MTKTHTTPERRATCGALAPDFTLADATRPAGSPLVRLRAWRQRAPILLALLPSPDVARNAAWLLALAGRADDLAIYGVVTLALTRETAARRLLGAVDVAFPLLMDGDGAALTAYLGAEAALPALAVIDRYSSLVALLPAHSPDDPPDLDMALRELAYADQQDCACALPAWED